MYKPRVIMVRGIWFGNANEKFNLPVLDYEIRIYNLFLPAKRVRCAGVWSTTEFFDHEFLGNQGRRKVWKFGWGKYKGGGAPLFRIGLTDLPKSGGGGGEMPPWPLLFHCLRP